MYEIMYPLTVRNHLFCNKRQILVYTKDLGSYEFT